jgi:hypothetical protein
VRHHADIGLSISRPSASHLGRADLVAFDEGSPAENLGATTPRSSGPRSKQGVDHLADLRADWVRLGNVGTASWDWVVHIE